MDSERGCLRICAGSREELAATKAAIAELLAEQAGPPPGGNRAPPSEGGWGYQEGDLLSGSVTILQQPLPELATLRVAASHFAKQGQSLGTGKTLPISGVTGAQMELRLNITVSGNTTLRCRNRLLAPFSN